jgi:hypothetical protein
MLAIPDIDTKIFVGGERQTLRRQMRQHHGIGRSDYEKGAYHHCVSGSPSL